MQSAGHAVTCPAPLNTLPKGRIPFVFELFSSQKPLKLCIKKYPSKGLFTKS
jgi:hypothetical protein